MRTTKKMIVWLCTVALIGGASGVALCVSHGRHQERIQFDVHMLSAARSLQEHNAEDAKFHLHVAIALNERRYAPFFNLSTIYLAEGKPEIAKQMLARALENTQLTQESISGDIDERVVQADRAAIENALAKLNTNDGPEHRGPVLQ